MDDLKNVNIPKNITLWKDDMRDWPAVDYGNIYNYLVHSKAVDGDAMNNFKSFDSYNYFESGSVGRILHHRFDEKYVVMKCEVRPSQRVKNDYYCPRVVCEDTGRILTGECNCMAGKSKSCSHVGTLLWKVEYAVKKGYCQRSCTDVLAKWNMGTTRYIEPGLVLGMEFCKPKPTSVLQLNQSRPNFDNPEINEQENVKSKFNMFLSHADLKSHVDNSDLKELFNLSNSTLKKSVTATPSEHNIPPSLSIPHGEHTGGIDSCEKCFCFFERYIKMTKPQIDELNAQTLDQSDSVLWTDSRKIRITGSTANKVPVRDSTNPENFIREHLYPSFTGNKFTKYGQKCERIAKQELVSSGIVLNDVGTIVSYDDPWFSASPDGIITSQNKNVLLEVKCPNVGEGSAFDTLSSLFLTGKYDVTTNNNVTFLQIHGPRGYYTQIQTSLHVTKLNLCKLVIWSENETKSVDVEYNSEYCCSIFERLRKFYFTKFLPRVVDDFNDGRLSLSKAYIDLTK